MREFDDVLEQANIMKSCMLLMSASGPMEPLPSLNRMEVYDHLVRTTLYSIINKEKFIYRVKEAYDDLLLTNDTVPELYEIVEYIDDENVAILYSFYEGAQIMSEEDFEIVMAHYIQDISCMLDDWVEEILKENNVEFRGLSLARKFQITHDSLNPIMDSESQNIINPEWVS